VRLIPLSRPVTITQAAPAKGAVPQPGATAAADLVDINSATNDQLKSLPSIGDAYSERIVDGRPYRTKHDLVLKKIIPQVTYSTIQDMIIAK